LKTALFDYRFSPAKASILFLNMKVLLQKFAFLTKHLELSSIEEKQIAESCFDWIIDVKSSSKAYAIRALYELKKYD
jgi:hypothetical protein